jgi:hypothetical protein
VVARDGRRTDKVCDGGVGGGEREKERVSPQLLQDLTFPLPPSRRSTRFFGRGGGAGGGGGGGGGGGNAGATAEEMCSQK